jgi:hypothetical protein
MTHTNGAMVNASARSEIVDIADGVPVHSVTNGKFAVSTRPNH